MSKKFRKKGIRANAPRPAPVRPARPRRYSVATLAACALMAASFAATRFEPVRRAVGLRPLLITPAQGNANLPLSKEYVYAGGRLVATEEPTATPTPTPVGPPPTNLSATLLSVSPPAATVTVSWTAPSGSAVGYVVERASAPGQFAPVGQPVTAPATNFNDATVSEGSAYLYRVKAIYAGGPSDYSNTDLATAVAFTDSPLQGTVIRARHLTELRRAVNAVRALAGMAAAVWTYPGPVSAPTSQRRAVYPEDVTDLRMRLEEALGPLGIPAGGYPAEPLLARGAVVNAQHFEQIRGRVR